MKLTDEELLKKLDHELYYIWVHLGTAKTLAKDEETKRRIELVEAEVRSLLNLLSERLDC